MSGRLILESASVPIYTTLAQTDIITRISESMLSHRDTGSCEKCNHPIQCHSCLTEFEVSIHNLEPIGHVLEFTSWKNFGSGRSPMVWETAKNKVHQCFADPFELLQNIIRTAFESHQSLETCHFQSSPRKAAFQSLNSPKLSRTRPISYQKTFNQPLDLTTP